VSTMKLIKPSSVSEKQTRTTMDTIELTPKLVASWKSPPFQRDLKFNAKVLAVSAAILRAGGVLPGVITIGILDGDTYIVDGQHRLAAWLHTAMMVGYADVRTHWFESLGDMANEFVLLNSPLVRLKPDDILRGLEPSTVALQRITRKCGFIGFDAVRRGSEKAPVLSMSVFLRTWVGTKPDVPSTGASGMTALASMDEAETTAAIEFVQLCFEAWRRDVEYARLWGSLNLTLCAWLYRRIVLGERMTGTSRSYRFTKEQFRKCLMALSAEPQYLDYLVGRNVGERDRAPAYARMKTIFQRRYLADTGQSLRLPSPAWAHQ
jgi:hypothetical protein